jgi:branched-chain amino acid transport system substrate-binding protein
MKVRTLALLASLVLVAACSSSSPSSSSGKGTLKVGAGLALTGALAPFDTPMLNGLRLGLDEINSGGGVDGKWKIDLAVNDMKSDPAVGASVGQSLVSSGINVLVTPCDQDPSIAVAQAGQAAGIPTLSGCAGSPTLPGAVGDHMFLTAMGANEQGAALADYAYNIAHYKTAYVLLTHDFAFGLTTPRYFEVAFKKLGGQIVGEDNYKILTGDFSAQVAKIKAMSPQPDVIQQSGFVPDPPTFVKQLRAAGVTTPVIGTDGSDSPILIQVGGPQVEGYTISTHAFPTPGSSVEKFYAKYQAKYGHAPESSFTAVGYDLSQNLAAALHAAQSTSPNAMLSAINNLENVQGATGTSTYKGRDRIPLKNCSLVQVKNGQMTLVKNEVVDPKLIPAPNSVSAA